MTEGWVKKRMGICCDGDNAKMFILGPTFTIINGDKH